MNSTADYNKDQLIAAVNALTDGVLALDRTEDERDFILMCATAAFRNNTDYTMKQVLRGIGKHLAGDVDRLALAATNAARAVARKEREAAIRESGRKPCGRCGATGMFINGGECWGCDGRGSIA